MLCAVRSMKAARLCNLPAIDLFAADVCAANRGIFVMSAAASEKVNAPELKP